MTRLAMIPVDARAKDGAYRLVQAGDGTRHCAAWTGTHWAYSNGCPVQGEVTHYMARLPGGVDRDAVPHR
ncbi:hypothetical protein SAMN05518801_10781 [Novosphingobium sp. CF614]|uniref:hypothetical protein n=1 Tax=Novosphingobium sp. CF614 TaxID=1884364 RepID=UPI0008EA3B3F|nr:hypothetical protein [Novosphingobium sp. CF614]SFG09250.1 hypothetical protein SAMN05518801_10781 [Novosphingobium sp. CF614]